MEHFIIGALLIAFAGLLVSRIHFHFSFNLTISRSKEGHVVRPVLRGGKRGVRAVTVPPAVQSIRPSQDEADLVSALLNLGCEKGKALKVAKAAMGQGVDFDSRVKWAVQNAA
jgi:hypothetical protein